MTQAFGVTAGGWAVYEASRPTIPDFSDEAKIARGNQPSPTARVSTPHERGFDLKNPKLLIEPSARDYDRYNKAYGFVAKIQDCASGDVAIPFQATAVLGLPFKFGPRKEESAWRSACPRVVAFDAKAVPPKMISRLVCFHSSPPEIFYRRACISQPYEALVIMGTLSPVSSPSRIVPTALLT